MENWQLFRDPQFDFQFLYPQRTTDGEATERIETQLEGLIRVHILAPTSREVYFEVSKYEALSAGAEYRHHQEHLSKQFHPLSITDLTESVCASLPGYEYSFEWSQGTRTVILVEREAATYRILFNPRSSINLPILSTVKWLNPL